MSLDVCRSDQIVKYLAKTNCGNDAEQKRCAAALIRLMADKAYGTATERHKQILIPKDFPLLSRATHHLGVRNIVASTLIAYPEDAMSFLDGLRETEYSAKATLAFCTGCVLGVMEAISSVWHDCLGANTHRVFDRAVAEFLVDIMSSKSGQQVPVDVEPSILSSAVAEYIGFPHSIHDSEIHLPVVIGGVERLAKKLKPLHFPRGKECRLGDLFLTEAGYKLFGEMSLEQRIGVVCQTLKAELKKYERETEETEAMCH